MSSKHQYPGTRMDERETTLRFDPISGLWIAWSNIPKHVNAMERRGWTMKSEDKYGAKFTAPEHAVGIRSTAKLKREMTEAQRDELRERMKRCRSAGKQEKTSA